MSLQLTVVKFPEGVSLSEQSCTFASEGGAIGRGSDNSWVLPDPDRFLSACHCEISESGGQYYVTDLSTNGTFVNGSPEPLGKGGSTLLSLGDTFELGDYSFEVTSISESGINESEVAPAFGDSPFSNSGDDSLFGSQAQMAGSSSFPGGGGIGDDFSLGEALSPDPIVADPLAALDSARGQSSPLDQNGGFGGSGFAMDDLAPTAPPVAAPPIGSYEDGAGALGQSVSWPSSSQQNIIPEEWDDDLMGDDPLAVPPEPIPPQVVASPQVAVPPPVPTPRAQTSRPPPRPKAEAAPKARQARPAKATPKRPASLEARKAVVRKNAIESIKAGNAFIDAMGLDSSELSNEQVLEVSQLAGELMREVVDGMMQLLRSRTSIKNEFRMNVTTIQPIENNPLKFSVNTEEALENMFIKKSSAYKEPVDAFREGFQGVAEHQVAIIAGIRYAFESMISRFDPTNLEKMFDKQGKGAVIPAMQKARYWAAYTEHYKSLLDNMENSFQHLFGDDFVQAYEDQLRRLVAERKNNN